MNLKSVTNVGFSYALVLAAAVSVGCGAETSREAAAEQGALQAPAAGSGGVVTPVNPYDQQANQQGDQQTGAQDIDSSSDSLNDCGDLESPSDNDVSIDENGPSQDDADDRLDEQNDRDSMSDESSRQGRCGPPPPPSTDTPASPAPAAAPAAPTL